MTPFRPGDWVRPAYHDDPLGVVVEVVRNPLERWTNDPWLVIYECDGKRYRSSSNCLRKCKPAARSWEAS